jgi:hypothetical protein
MVLTLLMLPASGRRADAKSHEVPIRDLRIAALPEGAAGSARLLREIDDPSSGTRWLLVRD